MNAPENHLRKVSATRRDFLQATSALGGSAVLVSLGASLRGEGAPADQPEPAKAPLSPGGVITIRGHHLFDMLDALATGKSTHPTLGPVAQKIRANPKVSIKLVIGVDDICAPCEWWDHQKSHCKKSLDKYPQDNENSLTSDRHAIRVLGLKPGDAMRADDLYRLIKAKVDKKVFAEKVCVACRLVNTCKETYEPKIQAAVKALSERA